MTQRTRSCAREFALRRRTQLLTCPDMPLGTRLKTLLTRHADPTPWVDQRVRQDGDDLIVSIRDFTFRVPDGGTPKQSRSRRTALAQVAAESFIQPVLFLRAARPAPGSVVLDVGANIGTTAAVLSRLVGPSGKVFAFEPGVAETLRRNVEANRLENVEVVEAAVGDHDGSIELSLGDGGIDSSIAYTLDWHGQKVTVPLVTLDDFVERRGLDRVDFIKMDIEGAEELALRGASRVIERFRPKWSISSYHRDMAGDRQHPKLVALLAEKGYTIVEVPFFHIYAT